MGCKGHRECFVDREKTGEKVLLCFGEFFVARVIIKDFVFALQLYICPFIHSDHDRIILLINLKAIHSYIINMLHKKIK